jgi:hypothetical protein
MKARIDLTIEKLIRSKYKNIELAKKDKRISALLKDNADINSLSKKEKALLIEILIS